MRKITLLLFTVLSALIARAGFMSGAGDDDHPAQAPVVNLSFATEEFIYVPIYTTSMGFRMLSGAKASFSGTSTIKSPSVDIGSPTGVYVLRTYADGSVGLDTRTDSNGVYIASADGLTPTFQYNLPASQESVNGYLAFHVNEAKVDDSTPRVKDPGSMAGFEVTVSRDLPNWLGKRVLLKVTAGFALNDIKSQVITDVPATISRTTDLYSLNGSLPPGTGYSGSTSGSITITNPDGSTSYLATNSATLISAQPNSRTTADTISNTAVTNTYKVKGGYFTARLGPTFVFPFSEKFRASLSLGFLALYSATKFDVDEEFRTDDQLPMTQSASDVEKKVLPGYYVDANLEYWVTEKTGFYAGAAYQGGGTYTQVISTEDIKYTTKIDLKSLSGVRAGMNIRF
ncbi:MAG: hypothetical protein WC378_02870 [Opitutaceae bacterium]|jgi:hypothetical protein